MSNYISNGKKSPRYMQYQKLPVSKPTTSTPSLCGGGVYTAEPVGSHHARNLSSGQKVKPMRKGAQYSELFNIQIEEPVEFLSFSQRKFNGFRGHVEFDKKRIVVASKNTFRVLGYENFSSDLKYELLYETLEEHEEIKYIDFIEDVVPKYLFMIVNDTKAKQSNLYIRLIKKNEAYFDKRF